MYSTNEVRGLIEAYTELREAKGVTGTRLSILLRLADLDQAISMMPPKEYHAVLLYGLLRNTLRDAEKCLGISRMTLRDRYDSGITWIAHYLNTGETD